MSTNSDKTKLPNQNKNVWSIDSDLLDTGELHPVNDHDTHYAITLIKDTQIDDLLDSINNAGWTKVLFLVPIICYECLELIFISRRRTESPPRGCRGF